MGLERKTFLNPLGVKPPLKLKLKLSMEDIRVSLENEENMYWKGENIFLYFVGVL